LKNHPGSQAEGLPESSRGSKRSADPRNRSIKDSHPESVPAQLCDPFQGQNTIAFLIRGYRYAQPRLLSRSPTGCRGLISARDYLIHHDARRRVLSTITLF